MRLPASFIRSVMRRVLPTTLRHWLSRTRHKLRGKALGLREYPYLRSHPWTALKYLLLDREVDNFTYDISNRESLAQFIAALANSDVTTVRSLMHELDDDHELRRELTHRMGCTAWFGRRLGWYALVRLLKPKLIVEIGVHDGLGSTAFLMALRANAAEGFPGRLVGIDIRADTGRLIPAELMPWFDFRLGSSHQVLATLSADEHVDLFLHDSVHTDEFQSEEFRWVEPRLAHRAMVLCDGTSAPSDYETGVPPGALEQFSNRSGRNFLFWAERSINHFYPGGGIEASVTTQ